MKNRSYSLWFAGFALMVALALPMYAQQTGQQPDQSTPGQPTAGQPQQPGQSPTGQPTQDPSQPSQQAPDAQAQSQPSTGQTFAGTILKSGDKYILQDMSGNKYDIDHQEIVAKYEGKKVRVNGTLDPDGKTIHVK